MKIRVGFGQDTHKLVKGRPMIIGGVHVPYHLGCEGHSDADALLHAICDAMLGAANMRDIGYHFPDKDMEYKDIDSKILLKKTKQLITEKGWRINNIDTTILLEHPAISPYIPEMKEIISLVLEIDIEDISIKAKTSEELGFIGREEGLSVYAIILLQQ
ncbi:MAG: 2-C-methyl-D-erythritol 2,4-cyclodiphosphate synthase [Bacteroidales bacterium]|jgi:2-C-methyl-D-erythritol 2,4-cyclodiphosphate synthase|nr:2-C-methyl-D-erythritol 2,4-cyclodiphosphate synthase [Bacteroidales bacterium]MDD4209377.1 2-C-methyl-D-erythritol 2,4-cyclodiphosphate synthase [Bacteroidales bacterium]MDY0015977.1 2-C-methyl-D-erythritol 2,4-cyclodiphosphate synthase [Bacteroidales bacterium]